MLIGVIRPTSLMDFNIVASYKKSWVIYSPINIQGNSSISTWDEEKDPCRLNQGCKSQRKKTPTAGLLWNHPNHFFLVVSTRLKNMQKSNWIISAGIRGEHKTYVETTNLAYELLVFLNKALLNPYQTVGGEIDFY